ncbi:MAG TPA: hypothetical protein VGL49_04175, partial [Acidimicrobiales bacterium]
MGRPGEFFDQDADGAGTDLSRLPERAGRGMLYDQDASVETSPVEPIIEARRQRVLDRQRERELEWRRESEFERERDARRRRAREEQRAQSPAGPLRISSRPGDP